MTCAGPFGEDGGVVGVLVAHDRIELAHDLVGYGNRSHAFACCDSHLHKKNTVEVPRMTSTGTEWFQVSGSKFQVRNTRNS